MADKFKNKYRIPSARLAHWDYGWNAAYFVTICTKNRECYLGDIIDGIVISLVLIEFDFLNLSHLNIAEVIRTHHIYHEVCQRAEGKREPFNLYASGIGRR